MSTKIEGLPIQKEWTVVGVREGKETDNPNGGKLKAFYVDFDGAPDVYWRRKMPASVESGKSYYGTVSEGQHGPTFKKETPQGGAGGGGQNLSSGASAGGGTTRRDWKPESSFDPEKVARMGRAHAQDMAIRYLVALDDMPSDFDGLVPVIDWFEHDVNRVGVAAQGTTAASPAVAAAVEQATTVTVDSPDPEYVLKVCRDAGLSTYPAQKLHSFIVRRLQPEGQQKAVDGLANFETQAETLDRLKAAYTKAEGEDLPASDPAEDDIPF